MWSLHADFDAVHAPALKLLTLGVYMVATFRMSVMSRGGAPAGSAAAMAPMASLIAAMSS